MNRVIIVIVVIAALGAIGYGLRLVWNRPLGTAEPSGASRLAPDFSLRDYGGNVVTLAQFRGKAVVVNAWAVWCPFCREELKDFAVVARELGDRVVIIAIDRAEPLETAKRFSDELGVTNDLLFLLDPADSFYQAIGGFSMPETILVDAGGKIIFHKRGPMDAAEIRQRVGKILNPKPETLNKSQ